MRSLPHATGPALHGTERGWSKCGSGGAGCAHRGVIAAGQSDPGLLQAVHEQVIAPNIKGFTARAALAQERGEIRPDADVATLRDVLYGVIEYRLFHDMPIEPEHIDALLTLTFDGVR